MKGTLPDGWAWTTLGEAFRWGSGGTPKSDRADYYGGDIPWAVIGDLNDGLVSETASTITEEGLSNSSAKWVDEGSVLIAMYGSIGKLGIAGRRLTTNQAIAFTDPRPIEPRYLFWYLRSIRDDLVALGKGGTQQNISQTVLKGVPFPLAPLPEQSRIVAALEEHLSALDAAVAGLERARANVHRFIASILSAAATGELLDGIALGDWEAVTLQDVVDPTRKCAYGVLQPGPNVEDGVPLVRVGDVNHGVVSARDLKRVSPAVASAYPRTRLRGGELLMTLVGTIGRTAVVPSELAGANVARAIGVIPVGSRARAEWLNIWFRSPGMLSFMNARAHEVARKTLNLEDVRAARVALPPIDVQDQLVATVERRTDAARRLMGELDTQLARANGLRRSILQCAFSGGLVPQDPAEAPASIAPERDRTERSSASASSRPARGRGRTARTGSRRG